MALTPTHDDKFSFGLWTIGWVGQDQFGGPSRAPLDVVEAVAELSEPTLNPGESYDDLIGAR
jgi:xylose isomerase